MTTAACPFDWCIDSECCTIPGKTPEHWSGIQYVVSSHPAYQAGPDQAPLTVGAGVSYNEDEDVVPPVVLHIQDGPFDVDADVFLTLEQAIEFRRLLNRAICIAEDVKRGVK